MHFFKNIVDLLVAVDELLHTLHKFLKVVAVQRVCPRLSKIVNEIVAQSDVVSVFERVQKRLVTANKSPQVTFFHFSRAQVHYLRHTLVSIQRHPSQSHVFIIF